MRKATCLSLAIAICGGLLFASVAIGAKIAGTTGPDDLFGTPKHDHIAGAAGADKIQGLGRGDRLHGDSGQDKVLGQTGDDKLYAGNGIADILRGGLGGDYLNAKDHHNDDLVRGGVGFDICVLDRDDTATSCEVIQGGQ